jgi:hypothetical protein
MKLKRTTISIVLATVILVSLFAVVSSAASVSGQANGTTAALATKPVGVISYGPYGPAAASSFSSGQWYIFAVDSTGALQFTSYGNSSTWNSLGGVCTASPAAVSWGSTPRFDVFVRGSNDALWHKYSNDGGSTWSNWGSLGGQLAAGTGPAVASWSAGRLDVFAEGANGALYHKWWNGATWSGWESLGGKLTASPAASSQGTNQIGVFVRGTNGACWYKEWTGTAWSSWESLGGQLAPNTGPGVDEALHLFVQGTDNQLWFKSANGAGTAWRTLGGAPPEALSTSSPSAGLPPDDHSMVCVSSTSGTVWYSTISLTGVWDTWSSAGSPP